MALIESIARGWPESFMNGDWCVEKLREGGQMSGPEGQRRTVDTQEASHERRPWSLKALSAETGT